MAVPRCNWITLDPEKGFRFADDTETEIVRIKSVDIDWLRTKLDEIDDAYYELRCDHEEKMKYLSGEYDDD